MGLMMKTSVAVLVVAIAGVSKGLEYDVVILHPDSGYAETYPEGGISDGQQVGDGETDDGGYHALLWYGTPESIVDLHPSGYSMSAAWDVSAGQQVGTGSLVGGYPQHALLWYSTPESVVDLHPSSGYSSEALGVGAGQQVGYVESGDSDDSVSHAVLWHGTPESMVDLHPDGYDGSAAHDTSGIQQVGEGWVDYFSVGHALLWSGTADSVVDLHPGGFESSMAKAIADGQQVGSADDHAMLWLGTADSAVDLHPDGYLDSSANGTNGNQQVGTGDTTDEISHALVWSGTPDSVIDLHTFLPEWYEGSEAHGIDEDGRIIGFAYGPIGIHAVMWVPRNDDGGCSIPAPGAILLGTLGAGLVGWMRERNAL